MELIKTDLEDLFILEPRVFGDNRGYFFEPYNQKVFEEKFSKVEFVQDNESMSSRGVLRGLHFQKPPFDQAKLVRCIQGEVIDVVVDIRLNSSTYGKHVEVLLSEDNKRQLFVPRGFAHGFAVLSEKAIFAYKVDNWYAPEYDSGIIWNDIDLNIDWRLKPEEVQLSDKDKDLISFKDFTTPFE